MTVGEMLRQMRDPLGAPVHPTILQVLLVLLFVLHVFFVTLAVGTSATALICLGRRTASAHARRLGTLAAKLTPNAVGLGVVTGIAPLLFVQTIYDPSWYAANTLMGFWSTSFIFVVVAAYGISYLFATRGAERGRHLWAAATSLVLLLTAGFIMHALAGTSIHPERWLDWYVGNGTLDTSGTAIHAVNAPRLASLLLVQALISLAVVLAVLPWHQQRHPDADPHFLEWVGNLGRRLGIIASLLLAGFGAWWAATQGNEFGVGVLVAILLLFAAGVMGAAFLRGWVGPWLLAAWAVGLTATSLAREVIRAASLERFGYHVSDYPYRWDWASIAIFLGTSVVGVLVVGYMAAVWFGWSRREGGTSDPPRFERLGVAAVAMLVLWFLVFGVTGVIVIAG